MLTSPLIMKFVKGLVQCAVEQYRGEFLTRCHSKAVYVFRAVGGIRGYIANHSNIL